MFCENRLGIKKSVISFVYLFCPNTGTKFREPYHSNHVIPHRDFYSSKDSNIPEISLYKAEKSKTKRRIKDKISEKVKPQVL